MADQPTTNALGPPSDGWPLVILGEILSPVGRSSRRLVVQDGETYSLLSAQLYGRGIVPKDRVSGKSLKTKVRFRVQKGDFLLLKIWARKGSYGFVRENYPNAVVSGDYPILSLDQERADEGFVEFFLSMPEAWASLSQGAKGSTNRQRVHETEFVRLIQIPLPPLPEQQAIAHVLRTVQQAKEAEATEKLIAAARQLKQSLMRHLFTYGPVPFDQADRAALKETEVGPVPEDWQIVALGDVTTDTQYGLSQRGEAQGRYPILRMSNLADGFITTNDLQYVNLGQHEFEKFRLRLGELLFNRTNSYELVGKTSLFDLEGEFVFASYLIRVVPNTDRLNPQFANYYMNTEASQARLKLLATRAVGQSNINATKLRGFMVPLPPLEEQAHIAAILSEADKKVRKEEARKLALEGLFQTLLHNLMTGKVRVHDVPAFATGSRPGCTTRGELT